MSEITDNIDLVDDEIDESLNLLQRKIERNQNSVFRRTLALTKELDLDNNGNIKQTVKNLRLLARIRLSMKNAIFNKSFESSINKYLETFPNVEKLNNRYFKAIAESFNPNRQLYREVLKNSMTAAKTSLMGAGVDVNVIDPAIDILNNSVTSGASYVDMIDELKVNMIGDPDRMGNMLRYAKQISTDAINQFNADYNHSVAKDLGLDWFFYSGGKRKTSRPFCKKYYNKYFHKKEVEDFGNKKDLDGSPLCSGSSQSNLCLGRVKGTNESNIFRYRGGYNCKHIYKPTSIDGVPKNVINRNIKKGYYEPE